MRRVDKDHEERKHFIKDFPDRGILRDALEIAALDDTEREAVRLFLRGVPIGIIADRLTYRGTYFSSDKFKRILIKYVYCVKKLQNEKNTGA